MAYDVQKNHHRMKQKGGYKNGYGGPVNFEDSYKRAAYGYGSNRNDDCGIVVSSSDPPAGGNFMGGGGNHFGKAQMNNNGFGGGMNIQSKPFSPYNNNGGFVPKRDMKFNDKGHHYGQMQ